MTQHRQALTLTSGEGQTGLLMRKSLSVTLLGLALSGFAGISADSARAAEPEDHFLGGYVAAVLEREFELHGVAVSVADGHVRIENSGLSGAELDRVRSALQTIRGVRRVEFAGHPAPAQTAGEAAAVSDLREPAVVVTNHEGRVFLPEGLLFKPLLADPRRPFIGASLRSYIDDPELDAVGAIAVGGTLPLVRDDGPFSGQWQLDFFGAVFGIFDLDAPSSDLINTDYWVGFPLSYRKGGFSGDFRIFHVSTHLGDEFLLRNRVDRVNVSYEGAHLLLSQEFLGSLRVYGGGGYLFSREPTSLGPGSAQFGVELESPRPFFSDLVRPILGIDLQGSEDNQWTPDVSVKVGLALEGSRNMRRAIELVLEYFDGRNPNGQFFERDLEYLGVGFQSRF